MSDGALNQDEIDALLSGVTYTYNSNPNREERTLEERLFLLEKKVEALTNTVDEFNKIVKEIKKAIIGDF
jgi:cell division septum initiation protein DivIVA